MIAFARGRAFALVALALGACGGDDVAGGGSGDTSGSGTTASEASAGTQGTQGSSGTSSTQGTSDTDASSGSSGSGESDASATAGTAADSSGSGGEIDCTPGALADCPVESCLQTWSFSCDECAARRPEIGDAECFEMSEGCNYPALACALGMPCARVWGQGAAAIESFEDEAAAVCLLQSLRDGVAGNYEILWGEMTDEGHVSMDVIVGADATVRLQWTVECEGCPTSGVVGRSGVLELQPTAWFDDCLAAPTTESLVQCVFGFVDFVPGQPPPPGYAPPFTTGECTELVFACPD